MMHYLITKDILSGYDRHLDGAGYSRATCQKYRGDLQQFCDYQGDKPVDEDACRHYHDYLMEHYTPKGACSKIIAVNAFFKYAGWECMIPIPKIDRSTVVNAGKELTVVEYKRLLRTARGQDSKRLYYLLQVLALTKITVSEHRYVTVEAVKEGYMEIPRGNGRRIVVIPDTLRHELADYAGRMHLERGPIFVSRTGKPWDRAAIHKSLKRLCKEAGIDEERVNTRSLAHVVAFGSAVYVINQK